MNCTVLFMQTGFIWSKCSVTSALPRNLWFTKSGEKEYYSGRQNLFGVNVTVSVLSFEEIYNSRNQDVQKEYWSWRQNLFGEECRISLSMLRIKFDTIENGTDFFSRDDCTLAIQMPTESTTSPVGAWPL